MDTKQETPGLSALMEELAGKDEVLARRLEAAGISASAIRSADDLNQVAVQPKDEFVAQRPAPAGWTPKRVFQSPGPIYEAQPPGEDPWRWGPALSSAGMAAGDVVINCFGYHLSPAGAMFDEGVSACGGTVVPGGIGAQAAQVAAIADLGVRGYVGLPSYLNALIEVWDAEGRDPDALPLEWALMTAEPLSDELRAKLEARVPSVRMAYGSAEAGLISYEDGAGPGMVVAEGIDVSICDPATGQPISEGQGEVVVSLLREHAPLIRFGTGDLSAWADEAETRIAGVLGRVGEAVKVRGLFLHPRQAAAALEDTAGLAGFQFRITHENHRDAVECLVVPDGTRDDESLVADVAARITAALRFNAKVHTVQSLPDGAGVLDDQR